MSKSIVLTIIASLAWLLISQTNAEENCCIDIAYSVIHACLGLPYELELDLRFMKVECWIQNDENACKKMCWSKFCTDGYRILGIQYCGLGKCNTRGCNCDGGCRKNEGIGHGKLKKAWLAEHGLVKKIQIDPTYVADKPKTSVIEYIFNTLRVVPSNFPLIF